MFRLFPGLLVLSIIFAGFLTFTLTSDDGTNAKNTPDGAAEVTFPKDVLSITTSDGRRHHFNIEVATTHEQKQRGLKFRTNIPDDSGMLFRFNGIRVVTMWMKETPSSLDMVFINFLGQVGRIVENTTPYSLEEISSEGPIIAVLELKGGTVAKLGIKSGDQIDYVGFKSN